MTAGVTITGDVDVRCGPFGGSSASSLRRSRDIVDHVGILPKYFARVFTSAQAR